MSRRPRRRGVPPVRILRDQRRATRHIGGGRRRCQAPPRRDQPGDGVERPVGHRDHAAREHDLRHQRHHRQRQHLIAGLRQRRHQQAEDRRRHTRRRDADEQFERRTAQQVRVRQRTLADRHDQHQDGRLDHGDRAEHGDLGGEIRRRRQPDGLLAAEDASLADQFADRQRGAHEERTEVHHAQDLLRLQRRGTAATACRGRRRRPPRVATARR